MKYVYVTRRARFNAAHKLWNDDWSEERNLETFGKCANPNWHGHNYELHVTIKGVPAEETGYCMDLKDLRDIIKEEVEVPLDHRNLNRKVSTFVRPCRPFEPHHSGSSTRLILRPESLFFLFVLIP